MLQVNITKNIFERREINYIDAAYILSDIQIVMGRNNHIHSDISKKFSNTTTNRICVDEIDLFDLNLLPFNVLAFPQHMLEQLWKKWDSLYNCLPLDVKLDPVMVRLASDVSSLCILPHDIIQNQSHLYNDPTEFIGTPDTTHHELARLIIQLSHCVYADGKFSAIALALVLSAHHELNYKTVGGNTYSNQTTNVSIASIL